MKYLSCLLLIILGAIFSSCNHSDEPPAEVSLPIIEAYVPVTLSFNKNDEAMAEKIKDFYDKRYIVNDKYELPKDTIGFSNAYKDIDFNKYTLLIAYDVTSYPIDTYSNSYKGNNIKKIYNWSIHIGTSTIPNSSAEENIFTRYSILVDKLSAESNVNIQITRKAINWN